MGFGVRGVVESYVEEMGCEGRVGSGRLLGMEWRMERGIGR